MINNVYLSVLVFPGSLCERLLSGLAATHESVASFEYCDKPYHLGAPFRFRRQTSSKLSFSSVNPLD